MYLELVRLSDNGIQTIGEMRLFDSAGNVLLRFDTLELSWRNNERSRSCVPLGMYCVRPQFSFRHGSCFLLYNVLGRDNILIHKGNFNQDTKGCILIGNGLRDVNFDEQYDVLNSAISMKNLLSTLKTQTTICITNKFYDYELK